MHRFDELLDVGAFYLGLFIVGVGKMAPVVVFILLAIAVTFGFPGWIIVVLGVLVMFMWYTRWELEHHYNKLVRLRRISSAHADMVSRQFVELAGILAKHELPQDLELDLAAFADNMHIDSARFKEQFG